MYFISDIISILQDPPFLGVLCDQCVYISGDILTTWNLHKVKCRAFHTCTGLLVQVSIRGMSAPISILNVYGPYRDREPFWEKALCGGLLSIPNLVLGGDLNLTL